MPKAWIFLFFPKAGHTSGGKTGAESSLDFLGSKQMGEWFNILNIGVHELTGTEGVFVLTILGAWQRHMEFRSPLL